MTILVTKIIIILLFAFSSNAFADGDSANIERIAKGLPIEETLYDTNKAGMVRIKKTFFNWGDNEEITIIHDKKGNLMFYRHYIYKKNLLLRTIENGFVRIIVSGTTKCDFKIIESSGDTISFRFDTEKFERNIDSGYDVIFDFSRKKFKIIKPYSESIFFRFDPKGKWPTQEEDEDIDFFKHLKIPKQVLPENKYDEIIYNKFDNDCKYTIGFWR